MTDTPTKRFVGSVLALLLNFLAIGFCWPLTALHPVVFWILALVLSLSDFYVSLWAFGYLPDTGRTREAEVYGWWMVIQILVIVIVVASALVHSGFAGFIVLMALMAVFSARAAATNKFMDIRVW